MLKVSVKFLKSCLAAATNKAMDMVAKTTTQEPNIKPVWIHVYPMCQYKCINK